MKKIYFLSLCVLFVHQSSHAQWTSVTPPFISTVRGLYFENADTGYAAGYDLSVGQVAKTVDGGATWTTTSVPGTYLFRAITFINKDTGFACGVNGTGIYPTTKGVVIKTVDGGASWNIVSTDTPQYFRAISFISPDIGFIGGAAGTILKTTDGGNTWDTYNLSQTTSDVIQLHMINASIGYAVCAGPTSPLFAPGYVFKTDDGGATWTSVCSNPGFGLLGLAAPNDLTVYAGGANQKIVKTTDGGVTWDTIYTGVPSNGIRCAFAVSENNIYMADDGTGNLGAGSVLHTSDGGLTWSSTSFTYGLFSIYFPSPTTGYLGDLIGGVYKLSCAPLAAPETIFGSTTVCSGVTEQFSIDSVAGADFYNWSVPPDAIINSGQGTTSIMVTFGALSGQISVTTADSLCGGGGSLSMGITVNPSPSPSITFSNNELSSSDASGNQWYMDGSPIPGATDPTYVPTADGVYYVVVTNDFGCTGTSNSITVLGTGIDNAYGYPVTIFPNPSVDESVLYFPKMENGKLNILNTAGLIEYSVNNLSGEEYRLNTSALSSGFYFIQLFDRENHLIAMAKLIVQ